MFNLQGSELIIILLLALVVLGPEKLPDAMRKAGKMYAEVKKMATGFQDEFRAAIDEPVREMRETADLLRDSADLTSLQSGARGEKPKSAEMGDAGATSSHGLEPADPDAVPVEYLPFGPDDADTPDEPEGSDEFAHLPDTEAAERADRELGADGDDLGEGEAGAGDGGERSEGI